MLKPEKYKTAEQIGYSVQAHCWALVYRVIGIRLVETNLKLFVKAVEQFWMTNIELWMLPPCDHVEIEWTPPSVVILARSASEEDKF
ncbi:hypothetical protein BGW36DRAFT_385411 [Talaromyces proteolyticus]|uniref:Uncharacterized protein n=1 Tax=Talaromyces proteolyticus TaxID=1131652 RepID=A0AAD4KHZ9_9EURO|nr:uncharacterized protein BGW36DRAFT_385411 [Talaromyces proteolyticus]KAH8692887.1 hypothetical protein BGW36DRAFT_385411 [Talaromyces proteolyticus]